jgi:protein tyrosine phosphatase (PTP) superfamily phosphohydrolase (DUF442 family)
LKASGSGQFSRDIFKNLLELVPVDASHLIVMDLREESHGFINDYAVSWTTLDGNEANRGLKLPEIESDELYRLKRAGDDGSIILVDSDENPMQIVIEDITTERELVEKEGAFYMRMPVTDRNAPNPEIIDAFVAFVHNLPSDYWIHFHCRAGRGRTTTFLVLYDMIKNHHKVSMEDIISRHHYIGGSDLTMLVKDKNIKETAVHRLKVIQEFYCYCEEVPDFKITWSEWLKTHQNHDGA